MEENLYDLETHYTAAALGSQVLKNSSFYGNIVLEKGADMRISAPF